MENRVRWEILALALAIVVAAYVWACAQPRYQRFGDSVVVLDTHTGTIFYPSGGNIGTPWAKSVMPR